MVRKGSGQSALSDSPQSVWYSSERRSSHREYTVYLSLYQLSSNVLYLLYILRMFQSPEEVPSAEDGFTECFSRIFADEMHIAPSLQEILLGS